MKIFVYLLVTVCACNATFLSLFQGKFGGNRGGGGHSSGSSYRVVNKGHGSAHAHAHSSSHGGHGGSPQVIKVIIVNGGSGAGSGSGGGYGYGSSGYGHGGGSSYGGPWGHGGGSNSYNFQLYEFLPYILQIILESNSGHGGGGGGAGYGGGGGDDIYSQLIAHYGESGTATVKQIQGNSENADYYSSGQVIHKGELKIKRLKEQSGHSSHGPPQHGNAW